MTRDEPLDPEADFVVCEDCGGDVSDEDVSFGLPEARWLCLDCATKRGGVWDGADERWVRAPDLAGLLDDPTGGAGRWRSSTAKARTGP